MKDGILGLIGNTPLVQLKCVISGFNFKLFAKLEGFNPGGSIKDRAAFNMIKRAMEMGQIDSRTTIIESSSGNLGIGLAQVCRYLGLRFICVVDAKITRSNLRILKSFGAEINLLTEPDSISGEFLQARIQRVKELVDTIPHSFWPNQYGNYYNAEAHYSTMREILDALDGNLNYLFCPTSSCGTIRGCAEYALQHSPSTKIVAVDAVGSVIFGRQSAERLIPGHGASLVPELLRKELVDECVHVSDWDCVVGCRQLLHSESLLVGGSSGGVFSAVVKNASRINPGAVCAMIFPDRGERYFDTIFCDEWVLEHWAVLPTTWGTMTARAEPAPERTK